MPRLVPALTAALAVAPAARADLTLTALGKAFTPAPAVTVAHQRQADARGNTSARNVGRGGLDWKKAGYFQRDRDLGQVFTAPRDFTLAAVVLRTGPADGAVLHGTAGAPVFVQFFEVSGDPRVDDNGTPPGTRATHGFGPNHRCDDFLTGVTYTPLRVAAGGTFPDLPPTRDAAGRPTGNAAGRLHYIRWAVTGDDRPRCEAGKRYCFVVGVAEPGPGRGFTLANANRADRPDDPALNDRHDAYRDGWAVRREADGTVPPNMRPGPNPPADEDVREGLVKQSVFPTGPARFAGPPTTDGYPDVDTYRDLEFYLEAADRR